MAHPKTLGVLFSLMIGLLGAQTFESEQKLDFSLRMTSPLLRVGAYEIGALDLSYGRGVVGSYLNPAALARGDYRRQVFVGVSLPKTSSTSMSLPVVSANPDEGLEFDLQVPTRLELRDPGGVDFLGYLQTLGPWSLGVGLWAPEHTEGQARGTFALTSPVRFDSVPSQYVSDQGDTVNLIWQLTGYGVANGTLEGSLKYSVQPFFFRVARRFGLLSVGLGYDLERLEARARLAGYGYLGVDSLHTIADSAFLLNGQPVTVVGDFRTILGDTVFRLDAEAKTRTLRHGFGLGFQANFLFLKLGLAGKVWLPTSFQVDPTFARMIRVQGIPDSVYYSPSTRLSSNLDTLYLTDTLGFGQLRKDTLEFLRAMATRIPTTLHLGVGLMMGPLHLSGTTDYIPSKDRGFGRFTAAVALVVPIPSGKLVFGYGQVGTYLIDRTGVVVPLMSVSSLNLGGTLEVGGLEVGAAVKLNPLALGLMFKSPLQKATEVQRPDLSSVLSLSFGVSKTWR